MSSSATGTFTSCGFGQPFSLSFTCTGADCDLFDDFPGVNCTTEGTTLSCSNGVLCPSPSNYTSTFTVSESQNAVTQFMQISLGDFCTVFNVTNNGTQSGVSVNSVAIDNCTQSTTPASSSASSTGSASYSTGGSVYTSSSDTYSNQNTATTLPSGSGSRGGASTTSTPGGSEYGVSSNYPVAESGEVSNSCSESHTMEGNPYTVAFVSELPTPASVEQESSFSEAAEETECSSSMHGEVAVASLARDITVSAVIPGHTPVQTSSARPLRREPKFLGYLCFFLLFSLFQLGAADSLFPSGDSRRVSAVVPIATKDTSPNLASPDIILRAGIPPSLGKQFTEILEDWIAGKIADGPTSPSGDPTEGLFAAIWSAVCSHYAGAALTAGAFVEIGALLEYLSLVFDTIALPGGPLGWGLAFVFAVSVNLVINELFPELSAMADQACETAQEKPLCSTHFQDDPQNCGSCGNVVCLTLRFASSLLDNG